MSWLVILLLVNLGAWGLFVYFLSRRRWTNASLAVALLHMLLIMPMGIAPLRALAEPDTFNLGLGWLQVQGALAAIPALMIWTWGLTAALIAVRNTTGRVMSLIAIGDFALAANFGTFFTVMALRGELVDAKAQGGEFVTLTGIAIAVAIVLIVAVPFTFSAFWALHRVRPAGPATPSAGAVSSHNHAGDDGGAPGDGGYLRSQTVGAAARCVR